MKTQTPLKQLILRAELGKVRLHRELSEKDHALIQEYAQNYLHYAEIYLAETAR